MRPLHSRQLKINSLDVFFSSIHTVLTLWDCIYHEFKDTCEEKKLNRVFQNDFAFSGFMHIGHSMNALVYFFAALPEAQIAVISALNLPRQRLPATCPIGHCCVCSPLLFAWEILCDSPGDSPGDSPTCSNQRMNKMSPSKWPCCLESQNARWRHAQWCLYDFFIACC